VLKPGGRFAVSDVVVLGDVPANIRRSMELWIGCIAGALQDAEYVTKLAKAGFIDVSVENWRVYDPADASAILTQAGITREAASAAAGKFASAFVRAKKPTTQTSCCKPDCCV
jgi:hypothetical protein